jgi:hypothetical protein
MKKDITTLFCSVDGFCKNVEQWLKDKAIENKKIRKPTRDPGLSIAEIITIILIYQQSPCKNFKYFYNSYLQLYRKEFPKLLSYNRFIELKSRALLHLTLLLQLYIQKTKRQEYPILTLPLSLFVIQKGYQETKYLKE